MIDHPSGAHDDIANAIAGLCGLASAKRSSYVSDLSWVGGPGLDGDWGWVAPPPTVDVRKQLIEQAARRRRWDPQRGWH